MLWMQAVNVALVSCFEWGTFSHCYNTEFKLPLSRPVTQQASSFIPTECFVILLCFWCMNILIFFLKVVIFFLISSILYVVILKGSQNVNLQCQIAPVFNFQNLHFYQYNNLKLLQCSVVIILIFPRFTSKEKVDYPFLTDSLTYLKLG